MIKAYVHKTGCHRGAGREVHGWVSGATFLMEIMKEEGVDYSPGQVINRLMDREVVEFNGTRYSLVEVRES